MVVKKFLIFLLLCFVLSSYSFSQHIEAQVTTDLRTLPVEKQEKLRGFADQVMHYINGHEWCEDPWRTDVYIDMQLILEDMTTSAEERYRGQVLIHNNYDLQFFDKRWRFAYQSGDILTHEQTSQNSFTSAIDFYIYLILGGEFDKWGTLAGTPYYKKAKEIAEQARFGLGRYIEGWDRRVELVDELLSERHKPYREMVDYYFYGLSYVNIDNAKAREHIATAIKRLDKIISDDPNNEYASKFIDAHHIEMLEVFRYAQDKSPLRTLLIIDGGHEKAYRDILEF
jgi:hypothetical protein